MSNTSQGSPTSTLFNRILIPVITTVLGATAIYFLGFNNKSGRSGMESMLVTKDATIKAWKSFVATQNISYKNINSLSEEFGVKVAEEAKSGFEGLVPLMKEYKTELLRESNKSCDDIEAILEKEQDIDRDFASMLKRTLDNEKDQQKKAISFFDNLTSIAKSDLSNEEKAAKWKKQSDKFLVMAENVEKRSANEAEAIAETLSEKYSQAFDLNQLLVYVDYKKGKEKTTNENTTNTDVNGGGPAPSDPNGGNPETERTDNPANNTSNEIQPTTSLLTGKWEMNNGYLDLSANGDMYWYFTGKGFTSGDWKLVNGRIRMNATNPDTQKTSLVIGEVSDLTQTSFTLTIMAEPREIYRFRKKN